MNLEISVTSGNNRKYQITKQTRQTQRCNSTETRDTDSDTQKYFTQVCTVTQEGQAL